MANIITISRIILAFIVISMLFIKDASIYWSAFLFTIIVIWMDGLDGYIARKLNESSKLGAVLDILGDRVVENIYWITFLALGWLPVWVPIIVVSRGIITDGLRSLALEQGHTAFGETTMMQSKIGKFLVASNFSRFSYAVFKAIAFAFMIAAHVPGAAYQGKDIVSIIAYASVYISVFFCVVRGIPVIIESKRFFTQEEVENKK